MNINLAKKVSQELEKFRIQWGDSGIAHDVEFLKEASGELGFKLWVKREDMLSPWGGSKIRKIQFLYPQKKFDEAEEIVIFGPTGSNHMVVNTKIAEFFGKEVTAVFFPTKNFDDPEDGAFIRSKTNYVVSSHVCKEVIMTSGPISAYIRSIIIYAGRRSKGKKVLLIPPGSSSPRSSLGLVKAVADLVIQIYERGIPEPDFIFVPAGTLGTLAGIEVGCRLCGLKTKVMGVQIAESFVSNRPRALWLSKRTASLIEKILKTKVKGIDPKIVKGFLGEGYGCPTEGARKAVKFFERFGLYLDITYLGKTANAMISLKKELAGKNVLFWYTFPGRPERMRERQTGLIEF